MPNTERERKLYRFENNKLIKELRWWIYIVKLEVNTGYIYLHIARECDQSFFFMQ